MSAATAGPSHLATRSSLTSRSEASRRLTPTVAANSYGNLPGSAGTRPDGRPSDRLTYWFPEDDATWMPADTEGVPEWALEAVAAFLASAPRL